VDDNTFFLWRVKVDGFIAFYNWVLCPIYNYMLYPFIWVAKMCFYPVTYVWGLVFGSSPEQAEAVAEAV